MDFKKKIAQVFEQDFKIVENKKKVFIPPLVVVAVAIIACLIFFFVSGSAFNVGMDFTGGYSMSIQIGNRLTDSNYKYYEDLAVGIAEDLKDEDGNKYGIKISSVQRQGEADTASLLIKYKAVGTETEMEEINGKLQDALSESMFFIKPEIVHIYEDDKKGIEARYSGYIFTGDYKENFKKKFAEVFDDEIDEIIVEDATVENGISTIIVTGRSFNTEEDIPRIEEIMTIEDTYGGMVTDGGQTSSTVSSEILKSAILAVSIGLLCMLVYIVIRFELLSGLAAVVALAHDMLMMVCFMAIFHIELNSSFIAALITVLGYSINNTIIIFDRVRENMRFMFGKKGPNGKLIKPAYIANKSVQETIWRSINTTITTLITISLIAIIGVSSIRIFALPIIFGLISGTYSSIFLAPTIWSMLASYFPGSLKAPKVKRSVLTKEK